MYYVKKPIAIQAIQFTPELTTEELNTFFGKKETDPDVYYARIGDSIKILTLEGEMTASFGDFIIKGIKGEFYPCKEEIFQESYDLFVEDEPKEVLNVERKSNPQDYISTAPKSLANTDANGAKKNVKDIVFWGDGDTFKLISKASSVNEGWMKSTKAMEIDGVGCVVQVTTQQRNPDGSYAITDSVTFVPDTKIEETTNDESLVISRKLIYQYENS